MAKEFFITGFGMISENGENSYFIPGFGVLNESSPIGACTPNSMTIQITMGQPTVTFHGAGGVSSMFLVL